MPIYARGNDVLSVNPPVGVDEALTQHGSDWLWAVTAIYVVCFLGLTSLCFTIRESDRVFHYLLAMTLLGGSVTYYAQAADLGWIAVEQTGSDITRQIFYSRYINWLLCFPSYSLALGMLAGVSWTTIICNIFCSLLWVLTYMVSAFTPTEYKWGFFAFGTFAYVILAMSTINESREEAARMGIVRDYMILSGFMNVLWLLYPIAFGLSDGGNVIGVTGGFVFFGILDVLAGPVWSVMFVMMCRNWDYRKLNLAFSDARHPIDKEMMPVPDKAN